MAQRDDIARLLHDTEYPERRPDGSARHPDYDWDRILISDAFEVVALMRDPRYLQADALLAAYQITDHDEETPEYQAGCGSWECRAPECGRA